MIKMEKKCDLSFYQPLEGKKKKTGYIDYFIDKM